VLYLAEQPARKIAEKPEMLCSLFYPCKIKKLHFIRAVLLKPMLHHEDATYRDMNQRVRFWKAENEQVKHLSRTKT
jgi:hypothetical protein